MTNDDHKQQTNEYTDSGQTVLAGNDGGFGLPEARTYERDDGTTGEIPPDEIFLAPLRTTANGWQKYHAHRDCGKQTVYYTENTSTPSRTTDRFDWKLACGSCGRHIRWDEILYISEEWFYSRNDAFDYRMFDNLYLDEEQVLELGANPMESQLIDAIRTAFEERDRMLEAHREKMKEQGIPAYQNEVSESDDA